MARRSLSRGRFKHRHPTLDSPSTTNETHDSSFDLGSTKKHPFTTGFTDAYATPRSRFRRESSRNAREQVDRRDAPIDGRSHSYSAPVRERPPRGKDSGPGVDARGVLSGIRGIDGLGGSYAKKGRDRSVYDDSGAKLSPFNYEQTTSTFSTPSPRRRLRLRQNKGEAHTDPSGKYSAFSFDQHKDILSTPSPRRRFRLLSTESEMHASPRDHPRYPHLSERSLQTLRYSDQRTNTPTASPRSGLGLLTKGEVQAFLCGQSPPHFLGKEDSVESHGTTRQCKACEARVNGCYLTCQHCDRKGCVVCLDFRKCKNGACSKEHCGNCFAKRASCDVQACQCGEELCFDCRFSKSSEDWDRSCAHCLRLIGIDPSVATRLQAVNNEAMTKLKEENELLQAERAKSSDQQDNVNEEITTAIEENSRLNKEIKALQQENSRLHSKLCRLRRLLLEDETHNCPQGDEINEKNANARHDHSCDN